MFVAPEATPDTLPLVPVLLLTVATLVSSLENTNCESLVISVPFKYACAFVVPLYAIVLLSIVLLLAVGCNRDVKQYENAKTLYDEGKFPLFFEMIII